jgi:hypothetical protein
MQQQLSQQAFVAISSVFVRLYFANHAILSPKSPVELKNRMTAQGEEISFT